MKHGGFAQFSVPKLLPKTGFIEYCKKGSFKLLASPGKSTATVCRNKRQTDDELRFWSTENKLTLRVSFCKPLKRLQNYTKILQNNTPSLYFNAGNKL